MFDIGFLELLIIFIVALLVLGPERLPQAARSVGLFVGRIKRTVGGVQAEIERELRLEEMRREAEARAKELEKELELKEFNQQVAQTEQEIKQSFEGKPLLATQSNPQPPEDKQPKEGHHD